MLFATLPTLGAIPAQCCVTRVSRVAKEERRYRADYYEFVINHTGNDRRAVLAALPVLGALPAIMRRAVLAAPGYDVLGERQADGALPRGRRGVAIVRPC